MAKTPKKPPEPPSAAVSAIERALDGVNLPQQRKRQVAARIAQTVVTERFQGPMPHPDHLRKYESILPGAADRMLRLAEKSVDHRIGTERFAHEADAKETRLGIYCGAGLFALLILAAFASLFVTDSPLVPSIFLGTAAVGGIAAFVNVTRRKSR